MPEVSDTITVKLLVGAVIAMAGAIVYVTQKWMKGKDKHISDTSKTTTMIIDLLEKNNDVISNIKSAIEINTKTGEAQTKAHERATDVFNELHKDILRGMVKEKKKR